MPRQSRGPYLYLKKAHPGHEAVWLIRDRINGRRKDTSTGCGIGASEQDRSAALAKYCTERHNPAPKSGGDPNQALVADCLSVYLEKKLKRSTPRPDDRRAISRQNEDRAITRRLVIYFGTYTVSELTGELQEAYAEQRGSQSSARRELSYLAAAINAYNKKKGGLTLQFSPVMPDALPSRDRCLTRQEAARLLRAAWRARQKNRGGKDGRYVGRHIARFILIGLYTGTRAGAICNAALMPAIGRGHVDLDRSVFVRKAQGARETNKRAPTVALPPRLLAHMRRWKRLGIAKHSVVEWCGKPVKNVRRGFVAARAAAGLDAKVIPHTLRHTAVSWYLREGTPTSIVADFVGMSEHILRKVYKHEMAGAFDPIMRASDSFGRTDGMRSSGAVLARQPAPLSHPQRVNMNRTNEHKMK
jgi:integrase